MTPKFTLLKRWQGEIVEVRETDFVVRVDRTRSILRIFDKEDVSPKDLHLLIPGAKLSYIVGWFDNISGQRSFTAEIRFDQPRCKCGETRRLTSIDGAVWRCPVCN